MQQTTPANRSPAPGPSAFASNEELQQRIDELERENQIKADFLALLSHELRTPLNAILGYTELLLSGIPEAIDRQARVHIERIHLSALHQSKLVNEVIRYARLESDGERIVDEAVDLHMLLEEVVSLVLPAATQKDLKLEVQCDCSLRLRTDPTRLRQILINLLANAIKFSNRGLITVKTVAATELLTIEVSDNGVGIEEAKLARVFEPFWRAEKSSGTDDGVGLGLAVSRTLARSLGGDLTVRSEFGAGSAFTLLLPGSLDR